MRDKMEYLSAGGWKMKDALIWTDRNISQEKRTSTREPDTIENFHRVPISDNHMGHKIATDTISMNHGVKAIVCVDCKMIVSFLFIIKNVYSFDYLKDMLKFKQKKLKNPPSSKVAGNYKHTIACLKREMKKRTGKVNG